MFDWIFFSPGSWPLQGPPEAAISTSLTSTGYQILAFIWDTVCCSRMKLGGVRLRFQKNGLIQNQKEIWIHITRDPHFPILSQSKYVNDCSLKVPIKAHMIKCYAFYLLYLRVVLFVGCLFGKYVGMHFFLSTQGKYTFVKKFTVNLVQSCDLTSVWIIALLIVEMLKSGILWPKPSVSTEKFWVETRLVK